MGTVLALVDDIFFQARIGTTAKQVGVQLKTFGTADALIEAARGTPAELIVIDLNARADALGALKQLQAMGNQTPVIAFLSHVQTELAESARTAGCTEVMPRSKFTQELAEILERAKR
jgi:DNA-binding NtrC family response regulator